MISDKTEADLKGELMEVLREGLPEFVFFRHEDRLTHHMPDITATGNRKTSWWEAKHAHPTLKRNGGQELKLQRLARVGWYARYIIWEERNGEARTRIVHPRNIREWNVSGESVEGFDHQWVLEAIRRVHV